MTSNQHFHKAIIFSLIAVLFLSNQASSQSWNITGNANIASATQYLGTRDPNDLVFRTNAIERGRVFGAGGAWRFGTAANNARIDSLGRLTFTGQGKYLVGANRYVFQYATTPNYGLFFNTAPLQYEFRNSAAAPVFTVNATTGAGIFKGTLKIGAYTLPATDGTNGQVLKTNGSGTVTWGNVNNNFWSLNGNAGTLPGSTSFLGTTDAKGLVFKTNSVERMRITNTGYIGIGTNLPDARFNVRVGNAVTLASTDSFLLGSIASTNLAFDANEIQARNNGAGAPLYLNYWGGYTWIGSHNGNGIPAVYAAADGSVGIGSSNVNAGYALTVNAGASSGGISIADPIDNTALIFSKSGVNYGAYFSKTSTSSGVETIYSYNAGSGSGIYSVSASGYGISGYSTSNIGILAGTGNSASYAGYFQGNVYTTGAYLPSDEKLKQNIQDFKSAMSVINQLHPKQYKYRQDGSYKKMNLPQGERYGLIAQEVEKVLPALIKETTFEVDRATPPADGVRTEPKNKGEVIDFKAINYIELIPIMIRGMQEQQEIIDKQQQQIEELKQLVQTALNNNDKNTSSLKSAPLSAGAYLQQNVPNPFSQNTTIRCRVPAGIRQAQLAVYGSDGKQLKTYTLNKSGVNTVTINAGTLAAGTYSYALLVDGKMVDSKSMFITR